MSDRLLTQPEISCTSTCIVQSIVAGATRNRVQSGFERSFFIKTASIPNQSKLPVLSHSSRLDWLGNCAAPIAAGPCGSCQTTDDISGVLQSSSTANQHHPLPPFGIVNHEAGTRQLALFILHFRCCAGKVEIGAIQVLRNAEEAK
jgi:hypothetical protein